MIAVSIKDPIYAVTISSLVGEYLELLRQRTG